MSFREMDTLQTKDIFEMEANQYSIIIQEYRMDNGIFTSQNFTDKLQNAGLLLTLSRVGAQHQNVAAEHAIQTVHNLARAIILHMAIYWPDEYNVKLWPFVLNYATWLYNPIPRKDNDLSPIKFSVE